MSNQTFCTFAAPSKWYTFRLQSGILFDYYLQFAYSASVLEHYLITEAEKLRERAGKNQSAVAIYETEFAVLS